SSGATSCTERSKNFRVRRGGIRSLKPPMAAVSVSGLQHLRNNQALAANDGSPRRDLAIPFNHIEGLQVAAQTVARVLDFLAAGCPSLGPPGSEIERPSPLCRQCRPERNRRRGDGAGARKVQWTPRPTSNRDFPRGT